MQKILQTCHCFTFINPNNTTLELFPIEVSLLFVVTFKKYKIAYTTDKSVIIENLRPTVGVEASIKIRQNSARDGEQKLISERS